jgi:hypothetical protein
MTYNFTLKPAQSTSRRCAHGGQDRTAAPAITSSGGGQRVVDVRGAT